MLQRIKNFLTRHKIILTGLITVLTATVAWIGDEVSFGDYVSQVIEAIRGMFG